MMSESSQNVCTKYSMMEYLFSMISIKLTGQLGKLILSVLGCKQFGSFMCPVESINNLLRKATCTLIPLHCLKSGCLG